MQIPGDEIATEELSHSFEDTAHNVPADAPFQVWEFTGDSIEEAKAHALAETGLNESEAVIDTIASTGLSAALPGEKLARQGVVVRVWKLDGNVKKAFIALRTLLEKMSIVATITPRIGGGDSSNLAPVILDVEGEDLGLLIGWRGETLYSLQTVLNMMIGGDGTGRKVVVDVERYRARREAQVAQMAIRVADRVLETGQAYRMDPMRAYERRAAHLALQNYKGVRTESMGEEMERRVVIHPVADRA